MFNPSADLMAGDYGRSAKPVSYAASARPRRFVNPFSGETINLGPFTIPPGEKIVIMFSATVNAANTFPPGTTQVCNQGSVSATGIPAFLTDDPDVAGSNNPTCTALNVADVSVTKSAGSSPVCSTSNITFTINYSNGGPASALDAVVSDAMPAGTSLVSVTTPATWTRTDLVPIGGNGTITFTKASSPNGDAAVFTIVVSINAGVTDGTVIQNTASVSSTTPDPNTANNTTTPTSTTVKTPPTATAGGPQTICATGTTAGLGGNTPPAGQTGTWSIVTAGVVGTFNPNANTPNATFTHTSGPGPFTLRWTVSNPPCTDATADVVISLLPAPVATTGGPQTICELGTTASLGGNTPAAGETGAWSIVTAGVTGTFNPDANTPGATFTHVSGGVGGTVTLRWTVTNPTCAQSATADAIITVNQQPAATAGGPQTICALGTTAGLGGNTPAGGATGTWTIVTAGATGTFTPNANTPNATFTHTAGTGAITLRWTIANPPCTDSFAEVIITINQAPAATVGGPQTICALGTTAGLGGNTPTGGATGTWTIVTAGATGTFNPNANTPDATFTHTTGTGTITLRWTVSNSPCVDATADVVITITQPPTTATVGPTQTIVPGGTTGGLGGNSPTSGTGMWSIVTAGATGTFNPNATTPNATWTHATGSGVIVLRWTITNPPCPDSFAEVNIQVGVPPVITCPPSPVVVNTAPGQCSATVKFEVTATGTPTPTVTCVPPSGSVFPKGNTTVNCTAANGIPPDAMCSFTVTVNDNQPPAITCPANITQSTDPDLCSAVVTYPAPTVTDNCPCNEARTKKQRLSGLATCQVVCLPASGSTFPKGTTTVTCTATDVSGNQAMCSFTVTVNDTQPPAITCPANITTKAAQAGDPCVVVNFTTPVATDNCPNPTVTCTPPSGTCFPVGTTTVTCTATDGSGNTASCTFKVSVFDLCLQDDSNSGTVLLINSVTGDYIFCCSGMTFSGKGTISKTGSTYKLTHNAIDRRVLATDDEAQHKGTASLQSPPGVTKCTITDRNTLNNSCTCGGG